MIEHLDILACQVHVPLISTVAERDAHICRLCDRVSAQLRTCNADLVLLPELSSIDYSRESFGKLSTLAETLDGTTFQQWQKISTEFNTHVAFGMPRKDENERYSVSSVVIAPDGSLVGHYDKIHLAQFGASMEKDYFVAGEKLFVFSINDFRLGTLICADIRFPEACRSLVVNQKVDVLLHPSAYSRDATFFSWHTFVQARAIENQIYVVSLNRAGRDYGKSIFVPPWVDESHSPKIFHDFDEQFLPLRLYRSELQESRDTYPFLKDRRSTY